MIENFKILKKTMLDLPFKVYDEIVEYGFERNNEYYKINVNQYYNPETKDMSYDIEILLLHFYNEEKGNILIPILDEIPIYSFLQKNYPNGTERKIEQDIKKIDVEFLNEIKILLDKDLPFKNDILAN